MMSTSSIACPAARAASHLCALMPLPCCAALSTCRRLVPTACTSKCGSCRVRLGAQVMTRFLAWLPGELASCQASLPAPQDRFRVASAPHAAS